MRSAGDPCAAGLGIIQIIPNSERKQDDSRSNLYQPEVCRRRNETFHLFQSGRSDANDRVEWLRVPELRRPHRGAGIAMSSYYFAARFSRRFELQGYRADLLRIGHEVTSRWIDDAGREDELEDPRGCAVRDMRDIEIADGIIAFLEIPRTATRGGRHVEFGIAAAEGKRLIAVGPERENVFYHLPEVEFFENWPAALATLAARPDRISLRDVWAPSMTLRRAA
jgi:hypothetical protein